MPTQYSLVPTAFLISIETDKAKMKKFFSKKSLQVVAMIMRVTTTTDVCANVERIKHQNCFINWAHANVTLWFTRRKQQNVMTKSQGQCGSILIVIIISSKKETSKFLLAQNVYVQNTRHCSVNILFFCILMLDTDEKSLWGFILSHIIVAVCVKINL